MRNQSVQTNKRLGTLIKISFLSAMAFLLMLIELPLPIFPAFLKIDLSDLPALVGAFALGPVAGVAIEFLKNILIILIKGSATAMVGEVANFFIGSILVFVSGYIYKKRNTRKNAIIGLILGTIFMTIAASIINYLVLIPVYSKAFGMPLDAIIGMGTAINSNITDLSTLIVWAIVPFNLIKGFIVSFVTVAIYKKISVVLKTSINETTKKKVAR
ncbi:ECF transporter S component [Clostridium frigidicarnis]|uniref:Riboflavin transporter n=1 Tax=Clostridium frigidicarnis TaxID=84698 RepID=A0A1I0XZQ2_9CLOT|nr:ECF transporter S component [Clostridium frigidicarnis]SFB06551.1 Riboflavin transporter FmnP [Clostridium frigidicarnis]